MVTISLDKIAKQYNSDWIFSGLSCEITPESPTVVLGSNGSGKSTLLQVILSAVTPTLGKVKYTQNGIEVLPENAFRLMSVSAPYIELIEEFTLEEMINFHGRLKPFSQNYSPLEVTRICKLETSFHKPIRNFSSGMKQRVKLALALLSDTPVVLLDEPTSNLDQAGIDWYNNLVSQHTANRTVIVCSNSIKHEYSFCTQSINLEDHKTIPDTDLWA